MNNANNIGSFLDKVPPQDLEAERCVLGSILMLNDSIDEVQSQITFNCFYSDAHRRIFKAVQEMYETGVRGIDAVTLRDELARRAELDIVGGTPYILQILETVPHAAHAEYYAKIVREKWLQRSVIEACTETLKEAYHGHEEMSDLLLTAENRLGSLSEGEVSEVTTMPDAVDEMQSRFFARMDDPEKVEGVEIEWGALRKLIGCYGQGWLIVLAARPGHGKTAVAGEMARHSAQHDDPALIVSLEMSVNQLTERLVSRLSGVPYRTIADGRAFQCEGGDALQERVYQASNDLRGLPIHIFQGRANASDLRHVIRSQVRKHGVKLVIVDYLQLVSDDSTRDNISTNDKVGKITRELKLLANELKVPIILLSQLNRGVEGRENKTPRLSDLRDSGNIEQDADIVCFLHRPSVYDPTDRPGWIVFTVPKNRHGPTGQCDLKCEIGIGKIWEEQQYIGIGHTPQG